MEVRRGRGGLPRGPLRDGVRVGMAAKFREGVVVVGSSAFRGRGEQGGRMEGDADGRGDGDGWEYAELGDDWTEGRWLKPL